MRSTKLTLLFISTLIYMRVSQAFAQNPVKPEEKTVAYIKKFNSDYTTSLLNKKPETLASYYADDIRLMPEFQKTIIDKTNALLYHQAFTARFDILEYSRAETEILTLGSRVVELGMFTMKLKLLSTGKDYELKGKYQNIWEKLENGKLLLITEAWNYNHALEMEEQLRFKEIPEVDVALQPHLPVNSPIRFELAGLNLLMEAAVSQHDERLWSQFYTSDGSFAYSRHQIYKGKKEIDAFLVQHSKELPVFEKLAIRNDRIDDLGEYVIEYASHIAIWRGGEYSGIGLGKDLRVWRREKNGSLKIFRHIGMYD